MYFPFLLGFLCPVFCVNGLGILLIQKVRYLLHALRLHGNSFSDKIALVLVIHSFFFQDLIWSAERFSKNHGEWLQAPI